MTNPKWEIGPVELIGGREAFIDAINEDQEDFRYSGRVRGQRGIMVSTGWHANGRYMYAESGHGHNLAPPPKKTVRVDAMWMVVYREGYVDVLSTEKAAKDDAHKKRAFAIRKIEPFEVTEGDGL